jgi:hypothetical protein
MKFCNCGKLAFTKKQNKVPPRNHTCALILWYEMACQFGPNVNSPAKQRKAKASHSYGKFTQFSPYFYCISRFCVGVNAPILVAYCIFPSVAHLPRRLSIPAIRHWSCQLWCLLHNPWLTNDCCIEKASFHISQTRSQVSTDLTWRARPLH